MDGIQEDNILLQRFDNVRDEIARLVSNQEKLQAKTQQLEADLQMYKRVFSDTNAEKKHLEEENQQLKNSEKQKGSAEKHPSASRVAVLLDGDGVIFIPELTALGQNGGHKAASKLSESIKDYIGSLNENDFQLSVYIFFNKRGLLETLHRCGYHSARTRLEDFVVGFNQASERFIMVDVGNGKEAADSKIKAFLEDEIRLPQTYKIFFGGCHDNGYVSTIRSHITSGYKHKLILLRSYTEHAAGFDELELPILAIPGLFITQKLVFTSSQDPLAASGSLPPSLFDVPLQDIVSPGIRGHILAQTIEPEGQVPTSCYSPSIYPDYLLYQSEQFAPAPGLDITSNHGNTTEGHSYPSVGVPRHVDPSLPLFKQKPPPCTVHYLSNNCKFGAQCRYGHDYVLEPKHYVEIKATAKKIPCPAVNKNQNCAWGDICCYGHVCPSGAKCYFFKKGKCKFVGANMHGIKLDTANMVI